MTSLTRQAALVSPDPATVSKPMVLGTLVSIILVAVVILFLSGCGGINVMGRDIPDREYKANYDRYIAREKLGLKPEGVHDEYGRIPSWDVAWNDYIGGHRGPSTKHRRLHRYILQERRKAGLPELSVRAD